MLRYKNNHLNFRSGRPLICLILMLLTPLILWGQIVVTNPGFGYDELEDEIPRQNTRFTNSGDFDLTYTISDELVGFENGERQGPERDDLGDLIDQFQPPQVGVGGRYVTGLAWDWNNSWMWLSESDNPLIVAVDPANNYQEAARFNGPGGGRDGASGAGWYADVLYLVGWVNQPFVYSYDTEGNNLGNINAGFSVGAVTCSQENGWLMIMGSNRDILVLDIENDYQEIGRFNDYQQFLQGQLAQSMCWVDLHRDGQLWINTRDDEGGGADVAWQIAVDTEEWECIDLIQSYVSDQQQMGHPRDGIGHDGVNLWLANWSEPNIRIVDDGNAELRMLLYEPVEGGLEPGEELELNYVIDFEGADPGTYHFLMEFRFENQDAGYAEVVQMSAVLSNNVPTAALSGQILDEGTGDPIEGALVELDRYEISRLTDENGEFSIVDLPLGAYELTITTPDYLQLTHQLDLEEEIGRAHV